MNVKFYDKMDLMLFYFNVTICNMNLHTLPTN